MYGKRENMLIAVDAGKDMTKACAKDEAGNWQTEIFKSRIYNLADGDINVLPSDLTKTYKVFFEGETYFVGDAGTKQEYKTSKTDQVNRLCQYVAITRFLNRGVTEHVQLVTGCPASVFSDAKLREEYIANIRGNGEIQIVVDEESYSFVFDDIIVRPEGAGALVVKPEWFINKNAMVIDIGGQNLNITVFDNLVIDADRMLTKNAGGVTVEQAIIKAFEKKGIENITTPVIRNAILNKQLKNAVLSEEQTAEIIHSEINKYIQKNINDEIEKNNINATLYDKVFIGGTSTMLKEYLLQYYPDAQFLSDLTTSQFVNAKGFYTMMVGVV